MHPACDKYLQVLWPTHDLLILIISLSGETQVESWLDAFCHDFRCCSSVKWWVIKRDSGPDRETSSRAELLCRMQQAAGVCFVQKAAWWRFNPDTDLKKCCFYWHWMEADRPLKHQTENVKKKTKKKQRNVVNFHFLKEAVQTENFQSNSRKRNFEKEHSRFRPHTKKNNLEMCLEL